VEELDEFLTHGCRQTPGNRFQHLTVEELDEFLTLHGGEYLVVEVQALTSQDLDHIRAIISNSRELRKAAAHLERVEDTDYLSLNLTPLQERLYRSLKAEGCLDLESDPDEWDNSGLYEWRVVEIVWPLEGYSRSEKKQAALRNRLRVLCHALNNKLLMAHSLLQVRRERGLLALVDTSKVSPILDAPGETSPADKNPTIEECMDLIKAYLADGSKDSKAVNDFCKEKGCKDATIRKARTRLKIGRRKIGFGTESKWQVHLPDAGTRRN